MEVRKKLGGLRHKIDRVDSEIVSLIGKRQRIVKDIGALKKKAKMAVTDELREKQVHARLSRLAKRHRIAGGLVRKVYHLIIRESRRLQRR